MIRRSSLLEPFGYKADMTFKGLGRDTKAFLRAAFAEHRLLLFRGQSLTRDQQQNHLGVFGEVAPAQQDNPVITTQGSSARAGGSAIPFHSEMVWAATPPWHVAACF